MQMALMALSTHHPTHMMGYKNYATTWLIFMAPERLALPENQHGLLSAQSCALDCLGCDELSQNNVDDTIRDLVYEIS